MTKLAGSGLDAARAIAIAPDGSILVAGVTSSPDFPVTGNAAAPSAVITNLNNTGFFAVQAINYATTPPISNVQTLFFGHLVPGPPNTGYVTKLNATGTGLVFSTFLGGSGQDSVSYLALDSASNIDLAGLTESPDFAGLTPAHPRAARVFNTNSRSSRG